MFHKHHLQHPSQLCAIHIEHCSVLTATGFESTFTITAPLRLLLLFLFYLLAHFCDFWATTMLPKNVDPPPTPLPWWDPELLGNMAISREYRLLLQGDCGTITHQSYLDLQQFFVF